MQHVVQLSGSEDFGPQYGGTASSHVSMQMDGGHTVVVELRNVPAFNPDRLHELEELAMDRLQRVAAIPPAIRTAVLERVLRVSRAA